jgi:hypothetical protein
MAASSSNRERGPARVRVVSPVYSIKRALRSISNSPTPRRSSLSSSFTLLSLARDVAASRREDS